MSHILLVFICLVFEEHQPRSYVGPAGMRIWSPPLSYKTEKFSKIRKKFGRESKLQLGALMKRNDIQGDSWKLTFLQHPYDSTGADYKSKGGLVCLY